MEEAAGTSRRRSTSSFPVQARAGHGLRHRGKAVPLADHRGTLLGVPSADQLGGWLVGRAPLASSDALLSSRQGTWRGAGAVATLLGWVRVAVDVGLGLVPPPKGDRLVEARRQAALCIHPCRRTVVVWIWPGARLIGVGDGDVPTVRVALIPIFKTLE